MDLPILTTHVVPDAPDYTSNVTQWTSMLDTLHDRLHDSMSQGKSSHINRHLQRGYLLARDRVQLLLDPDSPTLELLPLAGYDQEGCTPGASIIAVIGLVCGVECVVSANVPTLDGGAINEMSVKKSLRVHEIVEENRLPVISLVQTAGANLRQQANVFHVGGATFRNQARLSKKGIPVCSVVFGSSTAGGAYQPGMSDYVIMVKNQAQVFLGGPPLVKMATGEVTDAESLGGADMHSRVSGVSDQLALDEIDALAKARQWIASLHWKKRGQLPLQHMASVLEPLYPIEELLGIVSANIRIPYDCREVIARLVDGSRFLEFKPLYGSNLVCGWASIYGIQVGILGNNNVIFPQEANKATQFIELCNLKSTPLVYLQNITGFMVGRKYEEEGIIKAGARFINAVSNTPLPSITIVTGAAYGAGNYAMNGRAYRPRFLFSWPNSRCSVMGPDQLTGVMDIVMREAAQRANRSIDEEQAAMQKAMFHSLVEEQSDVYYTSSRALDDGIIDPRDTRVILGMCLSVVYGDVVEGGVLRGVSRM